jgi:hypothetical protein
MVRFGVPGQNVDSLSYVDRRLSTVPVIQSVRRPTTTDKKFPIWCEWRVNKNASSPATEGEFWKLIKFESNGDATWVRIDITTGNAGITNWIIVTDTSDDIESKTGYVANNGSLVTLTLPSACVLGDEFRVLVKGSGLVRIAQNASDQIIFGNQSTTVGAGGYIEATSVGDSVHIVCVDANEYYVLDGVGNWTII